MVSNSCRQFHFSQAFCKFIEAIFVFFGVKSSWLHQQVLTEATSNSCDWRLTLFAPPYPRQRKLSPSMSRKIWIQIHWLLESQVRWIPTKRSLRVLYSSVEQQLYIYAACVCLCFVDCWRLEHWCAAFEDIFRFRWFLSCTLIPFSCSLTENLSSDLLFKHYFFIFTRFLLLLFLQVIQMWFCDLSTLCKQRTIRVATALKFWPTLELSSGKTYLFAS